MDGQGEWQEGFCSCGGDAGICLRAWFLPCALYGSTAQRLDDFPNLENPDWCDSNCAIMCFATLCHAHWLPTLLKRLDVRKKFGIRGNGCTDCLASYCCFPCTLAQMEAEVRQRAVQARSSNNMQQPYAQQTQGMVYQTPEKQPM